MIYWTKVLIISCLAVVLVVSTTVAFVYYDFPSEPVIKAKVKNEIQQTDLTKPSSPNKNTKEYRLEEITPYRIAAYFWENREADPNLVWQKLGIESNYSGERHYDSVNGFFNKCHGCEANVFDYELDGEPGNEVLVRLSDSLQEACRYLIFKENETNSTMDAWKLLGHIDHDFGRYGMPQHLVLLSDNRSWLIVHVQESSGSGVALYHNRLFDINPNGAYEVLNFPANGHQSGFSYSPGRDFSSRIVSCVTKNGITNIEVEYSVSYHTDNSNQELSLWTERQKATYVRSSAVTKAVLDLSRSDLSEQEIEAVYSDSLTNEDFLRHNLDELMKIATAKDTRKKEWLRRFLGECDDAPEKNTLIQTLR